MKSNNINVTNKKNLFQMLQLFKYLYFSMCFLFIFFFSSYLLAAGALESKIFDTISDLIRIINILIVGFVAWSGFLIARGDSSGMTRLIYGIIGLVVVNSAYMIIYYFR